MPAELLNPSPEPIAVKSALKLDGLTSQDLRDVAATLHADYNALAFRFNQLQLNSQRNEQNFLEAGLELVQATTERDGLQHKLDGACKAAAGDTPFVIKGVEVK